MNKIHLKKVPVKKAKKKKHNIIEKIIEGIDTDILLLFVSSLQLSFFLSMITFVVIAVFCCKLDFLIYFIVNFLFVGLLEWFRKRFL